MNVLFIGGGRRYELAKMWIDRGYNPIFYELDKRVPIAKICKVIEGKKFSDPHIITDIHNRGIVPYQPILVIPLHDLALPIIQEMDGERGFDDLCVISSSSGVSIATDKLALEKFMLENFVDFYPKLDKVVGEEFIAKPRHGFGSKDIYTGVWASYHVELNLGSEPINVLQKYIKGTEYSVDCYFTNRSEFVDCVPRERIRVGSGEVVTSKTIDSWLMGHLCKDIGEKVGFKGPINFQFIREEDTEKFYLIEVNARFGGGMTFSMKAGLDIISLIERDWLGKEYDYSPNKWERGLLLERSYRDHVFT